MVTGAGYVARVLPSFVFQLLTSMTDNTCASPTLPVEILDLIVKDVGEDADFKTLRSLRLVCKSVNELAGPIVFRKLTIRMKKSTMAWIQNQLPALAESGSNSPSANARWTKELHIFDLTPMAPIVRSNPHALPGDFLDEEEEKIIRTVQSTYLAQAIQSLNNVESVYFAISPQEPHADVFWALAKLPNLQQLRLTLSRSLDVNEQLPISVFPSKLRALEVGHMATHPSVLAVVGAWIGKSPCLEELRLGPVTWGFLPVDPTSDRAVPTPRTRFPPAEIERIFEDTVDRVPKLKKLVVDDPGLMFRSTSVPHLRNLTHLSIVGDHEGLPSFWDALSRAGVCLRHLTANLSPGLAVLNYLTSYRGLEELHLTAAAVEVAADIPRKCFHEVLPRHQHSLRHLSFSSMQFESWSITEEYLEGLLCGSVHPAHAYRRTSSMPSIPSGATSTQKTPVSAAFHFPNAYDKGDDEIVSLLHL
ncbi:hypothetical protein MD484_g2271, partial [Candolleomyces efflorescens]